MFMIPISLIVVSSFIYCCLFYNLNKVLIKISSKIHIYNKIATLQYNRLNNPDYINRNPISLFKDNLLENSYTIIDKIV